MAYKSIEKYREYSRLYMQKYRREHPEKRREWEKNYRKNHPDQLRLKQQRAVLRNPEKFRARRLARHALATGKIQKSEVCYDCKTKGYTEMHHENYSKPYVVVWLCRRCHRLRE